MVLVEAVDGVEFQFNSVIAMNTLEDCESLWSEARFPAENSALSPSKAKNVWSSCVVATMTIERD